MINNDIVIDEPFSADIEKNATRKGFGVGFLEAGKINNDIVALCADLSGSTKMDLFKKKFPKRYFDVGVAEQNMAAVASGMANVGKIPFISSFSTFSPGRNWEQIRTTISLNNANVKIIGTHAGVITGQDGATHQATEDIATTRVMANMTVIVPCDYEEAVKATLAIAKTKGPVYMRLARVKTPIFTKKNAPFTIGKANVLTEGKNVAIIACGPNVYEALLAYKRLKRSKINARVINCHTIKPLDEKTILKAAKECKLIVTVEDHITLGGLGGAIAELVSEKQPRKIIRLGLKDRFGESGTSEELMRLIGIDSNSIVKAVRNGLKKK